ncbi:MAG: hypothetical protein CW338_08200, partial [Clostridiales bacterium]|nr:hypothetical protein [Clostridiales bacterium]
YILPYATLLLKKGGEENYRLVMEMLKKCQKAPDLTQQYRIRLFINYAAAQYKLGETAAAIRNMESIARKNITGDIYTVLGYLYVEAGQQEIPIPANTGEGSEGTEEDAEGENSSASAETLSSREYYFRKAIEFGQKGIEYDDEDPIVLDNMGQAYYRLAGDKVTAREYFEKAIALNPKQIDTLYFLSRYDIEEEKYQDAIDKLETALEGNFSVLNYCTKEMCESELASLKEKL